MAFNYSIVSALPLRFHVASVEVFHAVAERVLWLGVLLKWGGAVVVDVSRKIHKINCHPSCTVALVSPSI